MRLIPVMAGCKVIPALAMATPAIPAKEEFARAPSLATLATLAIAKLPSSPSRPVACDVSEKLDSVAVWNAATEQEVRAWLAQIGEDDAQTIEEVLSHCRADAQACHYFLSRAREQGAAALEDDDRRSCRQCSRLSVNGTCLAHWQQQGAQGRPYTPIKDLPRRCPDYVPGPNDPHRASGTQRWPGLKPNPVFHMEE